MTRRESQNKKIFQHLQDHGNITWAAAEQYGVKRLAARIPEIRDRFDVDIKSKMVYHGKELKFARYTLIQ